MNSEGTCRHCGARNSCRPPRLPPSGRFGKNVYVQATLHKFEERLPYGKMASALERSGLKISAPAELELLWRESRWLRPEYERIWSEIRNSPPSTQIRPESRWMGANFWIWVFTSERATLFAIRKRKSPEDPERDPRGGLEGDAGLRWFEIPPQLRQAKRLPDPALLGPPAGRCPGACRKITGGQRAE
ncbi:MAG: transposase [Candidatus Hadarchaeales archaeon]